jgi:choline dehydrogenase-like flavoprotein
VILDPLHDPADLAALRSGVEAARELLRDPSFREIVAEVYVDAHGTRLEGLRSVDDVESWLRSSATTYLHACCTCAMGTVVDQEGAVHDHDGLYVCDASVFPFVPEVNTHLPTVMLAERLAARWLRGRDSGSGTDAVR